MYIIVPGGKMPHNFIAMQRIRTTTLCPAKIYTTWLVERRPGLGYCLIDHSIRFELTLIHKIGFIALTFRAGRHATKQNMENHTRAASGRNQHLGLKDLHCQGQEVRVPPLLTGILKEFSKAAIRTQPLDLLLWSGAYFRALATGDILPVKDRWEYPSEASACGLTPGLLRVIHKQFNMKKHLATSEMKTRWVSLCLPPAEFDRILCSAKVDTSQSISCVTFLALAARTIGRDLADTMELICAVLTDQPEGCTPCITFSVFKEVYEVLADIENPKIPAERVACVLEYLKTCADSNLGLVGPPDFDPVRCPPLQ